MCVSKVITWNHIEVKKMFISATNSDIKGYTKCIHKCIKSESYVI